MTTKSNPTTWDDYQYGTSPVGSTRTASSNRNVSFDEGQGSPSVSSGLLGVPHDERHDSNNTQTLRRRRSSIAMRLAQVGGVNSIENFARSWTRAAGFIEVTPQRPSFILAEGADPEVIHYGRTEREYGDMPRTSLLRAHLEASGSPEQAVDDESVAPETESDPNTPMPLKRGQEEGKRLGSDMPSVQGSVRGSNSIFAIAPHLATPLAGSYGTSYGTLQSTLNESSMTQAADLWRQQQDTQPSDGERAPLLVKEVEQDGKIVLVVAGQSTLPQTIFNSTNVLIGVGLLSLPLGIKYAGWLCGMIFLLLSALVTAYTARLLAKCMDVDASLITFADLAFVSYGQKARIATSILFTLELLAACVALVVLFADTLDLLIPGVGVNQWKILCGLLLIPLNFAPLRVLSFSSVVGIFSCFCIVLLVIISGLLKPTAPGSLLSPAPTYLFPSNWLTLPLSFGLLMSPWGGHSVFPNIYRDMRHPHKFPRAIKTTFAFTYALDATTAIAGILMFGDDVLTEITANIIGTADGYPQIVPLLLSIAIAIIPLTKVPLNARPIVSTLEMLFGLDASTLAAAPALTGLSGWSRGLLRVTIRVLVVVVFVIIAIVFPAFDSIMAFMGSSLCFTICVILPLLFYLKIFGDQVSSKERLLDWFLIVVCSILALVGTVWAFLPKGIIGAE